jgi:hypothetical protein
VKQDFDTCAKPLPAEHIIIPSGSQVSKAFTIVKAFLCLKNPPSVEDLEGILMRHKKKGL